MTLAVLFYVIAIVLMVLGSCGVPSGRVDLWRLGAAFALAAFVFGGTVIVR
jgi:hypothetical protein